MDDLKIVYLDPNELTPYKNNTRKHTPEDIEGIKESIRQVGFSDPIGIWGENNLIVEGHGRQIAAIEMGLDRVPCIRLDHMTEQQRKNYAIRHNRSAEMSSWDFKKLEEELADLKMQGVNMDDLKFEFDFDFENDNEEKKNIYTPVVNIPQYIPSGEKPPIDELVETSKVNELINNIENTDISNDVKEFLKIAAYRHAVIDFDKVADYYAESSPEVQRLMEESALVIIDVDNAIANGYAQLQSTLDNLMEDTPDEE